MSSERLLTTDLLHLQAESRLRTHICLKSPQTCEGPGQQLVKPGSGVCWGSDNELWSSFGRRHMSASAGRLQQQTQSCQDDQLHRGHKTIPVSQTQPEPGHQEWRASGRAECDLTWHRRQHHVPRPLDLIELTEDDVEPAQRAGTDSYQPAVLWYKRARTAESDHIWLHREPITGPEEHPRNNRRCSQLWRLLADINRTNSDNHSEDHMWCRFTLQEPRSDQCLWQEVFKVDKKLWKLSIFRSLTKQDIEDNLGTSDLHFWLLSDNLKTINLLE